MIRDKKITYAKSGVNIKAGNKAIDLIKTRVQKTFQYYSGKIISGTETSWK